MKHALRSLVAALLATLLALPVAAQPVDQETYDLMRGTRDQVADALYDVQMEQMALLDQYRSPDWIIYDTGDKVLTIDLKRWKEQLPTLQLWLMIPGSTDIMLSAMRRSDPWSYKQMIENTAFFRDVIREPGDLEDLLGVWHVNDVTKRLREHYAQSEAQRKAAFEKRMDKLEEDRKNLQEVLDFMDAELEKMRQEMEGVAASAEPDPEACLPDGENALDALCADLGDEGDDDDDDDPEAPVEAYSLWDGCWATPWGQLRLDEPATNIEGRLTWEDDEGEKHEIVHTYQPMISGYSDRLAGDFYGPLPGFEFECPVAQAGRSQWGTVRMDYGVGQGRSFHASYLPCGDPENYGFIQLDGEWDQALEVCDAAPDPETERWVGAWESNLGTLHIQPSGSGLTGSLESERGSAKLTIATAGPEILQGSFVGPIDGPWLPESILDRAPAGVCPTERGGEESWGDFHLYYSEGNDYWQEINDPRDDEFGGFWSPCDQAWREEIYNTGFSHEFHGWRLVTE